MSTVRTDNRTVIILPDGMAWRLLIEGRGEWQSHRFETIGELAEHLDASTRVHVLLPARQTLWVPLELARAEADELRDMARLQLEKAVPFPAEDVPLEIADLGSPGSIESEPTGLFSVLLLNDEAVQRLLQPILDRGAWPVAARSHLAVRAASCPRDESALLLAREGDTLSVALGRSSRLAFLGTLPLQDNAPPSLTQIDRLLWSAEMNSVPTRIDTIYLDDACQPWAQSLKTHFGAEASPMRWRPALPLPGTDLAPAEWKRRREEAAAAASARGVFALAGVAYVALVLVLAAFLFYAQSQLNQTRAKANAMLAESATIAVKRSHWRAWSAAIEREQYAIETLNLVVSSIENPEVRITRFQIEDDIMRVDGEAPTLKVANDLVPRLKRALSSAALPFEITGSSIDLLDDVRAKFTINATRLAPDTLSNPPAQTATTPPSPAAYRFSTTSGG